MPKTETAADIFLRSSEYGVSSSSPSMSRSTSLVDGALENSEQSTAAGPTRDAVQQQMSTQEALHSITLRQKILVLLMCIQSLSTYIMIALISPFYPDIAVKKGATVTQVNTVFSILFLTIFLTSPVFGKYLTAIGPKFMYLSGMYVRITADLCFGFLNYMPDGTVFIFMSFLIRIIGAVGNSAFSVAAYALIATEFPDKVSVMFGLLQTMNACGLMLGPPVGGVLYDLGVGLAIEQYTFPFLCSAVFGIGITMINTFFLPTSGGGQQVEAEEGQETKKQGMLALLRNPRIIVNLLAVSMAYMPWLHTEISLEPHLDQFGLTPTFVGLMFTCQTASYAIFASIWGWIDNRWFYPHPQMLVGATIYVFACLLIGPTPLFGMDAYLWLVGVSLAVIGLSASAMNIASFKDSLNEALRMGMPNNFDTTGLISGLFMGAFTFGAFIGPTVGGAITEAYEENGYAWSMTLYGFVQVAFMGVLIVAITCWYRRSGGSGENTPLLNNSLSKANSL